MPSTQLVALVVTFLPLITIHGSYLIAASHGHVGWCFPYGMDCTSISATGRHAPETYFFKPLMTASAVFMLFYWQICVRYLKLLEVDAPKRIISLSVLGMLAPLFLILYTTFLGEYGDLYEQLRRTGITLSFTFSYMCQLLLSSCLINLPNPSRNVVYAFRVNILLLILGVLTIILDLVLGKGYDRLENGFEWTFALLFAVHSFLIYREWREKNFSLSFNTD